MPKTDDMADRFIREISLNSGLIYKVCYMYAEDAEHLKDLYQEVVANAWQGYCSYGGDAKISTWLYRVAINTCVSFLRRNSRHGGHSTIDGLTCEIADDSQEHAMQLSQMYELIGLLGRVDKALIMLWLDEYSYDEIAAMTGLTRNNVATRLSRIKQRLINSQK